MYAREKIWELENLSLEGLNPYEIALLSYSNPPNLNLSEPEETNIHLYSKDWLAWPTAILTNLRYYDFESQDLRLFVNRLEPRYWRGFEPNQLNSVWHATRELCRFLEENTEGARPEGLDPHNFSLKVAEIGRDRYFENLESLERKGLAIDPFGFGIGETVLTLVVMGVTPIDFMHETSKGRKVKTRIKTLLFEYEHEHIRNTKIEKTSLHLNAKARSLLENLRDMFLRPEG